VQLEVPREEASNDRLLAAGLGGSLLGMLGGGFLGYHLANDDSDDPEISRALGALVVGGLSSVALTTIFVHRANGGRGNVGGAFAGTLLGTVAAVAISQMSRQSEVFFVSVPLAQAVGAVLGIR
jgi:hypothetical protein